jgi:hypothetical protein
VVLILFFVVRHTPRLMRLMVEVETDALWERVIKFYPATPPSRSG